MRLTYSLTVLLFALGCFFSFTLPHAKAQNGQERYSIQFRLPPDKNEVWNFVEMISGLGYPSYMYTEETENSATKYYAQMGSYASIIDAIDAASSLNRKVSVEYDIVHTNTNTIVKLGLGQKKVPVTAAKSRPKPSENIQLPAENKPGRQAPRKSIAATPKLPATAQLTPPRPPKLPQKPAAPVTSAKMPAPAAAAPAATAPQGKKIYLLQIFSFQILNNAIQTAKNYKRKGYDPLIIKLYDAKDKEWFVVGVGYAATQEQAASLAQRFAQKEGKRPTLNNIDARFLQTRRVAYE